MSDQFEPEIEEVRAYCEQHHVGLQQARRALRRERLIQEVYGLYDLSDPKAADIVRLVLMELLGEDH